MQNGPRLSLVALKNVGKRLLRQLRHPSAFSQRVWGLGFSFLIFPGNSRRPNRAGSFSDFNLLLWFYGNVLYSTISLGWIMLPLVAEENRGAE